MEDRAENLAKIDAALVGTLTDGVANESISTPNGGSRSVSILTPSQILEGKRALMRDMGADAIVRIYGGAPACVSYPKVK